MCIERANFEKIWERREEKLDLYIGKKKEYEKEQIKNKWKGSEI
jgi:hypothetical protein